MADRIVYLMSDTPHLFYLVPSLYTLRQQTSTPVTVYAYDQSFDYVERIAADKRLEIEARRWHPEVRYKKNCQFINKIVLLQSLSDDCVLYLDADTTIHGELDELFDIAEQTGFCATQFNLWTVAGGVIRTRLKRIGEVEGMNAEALSCLEDVLNTKSYPSLNGGIFACKPTSEVLKTWHEWTLQAKDIFIADECVLHLLQVHYGMHDFAILEGGRYNCSWKYDKDIPKPVVRHYHGHSCTRPDKSPKAHAFWWKLYQECIDQNIGGLRDWKNEITNNKWMNRLLKQMESSK